MSWFSQFIHSVANGALGAPPVQHPDGATNPVHAAVDGFNTAGAALGSTLTGAAETEVGALLTKYVGPAGPDLEQLFLGALLGAVQAKLAPPPAPNPATVLGNIAS